MPKNPAVSASPLANEGVFTSTPNNMTLEQYAMIQIVAAVATTRSTTARETVSFAKQVFDELKSRNLL